MRRRLLTTLFTFLLLHSITQSAFASIIISEVHPNPTTGSEWVELYNPDSTTIDLTGWVLEDQLSTPSIAATLTQTIAPLTYLAIDLPTAKLNNTVDGVTLRDPTGVIIDVMSYSSTTAGQSWARTSPQLAAPFQNTPPTKNAANPLPSPSPSPSPTTLPTPSPPTTPSPTPFASPPAWPLLGDFTLSELQACPSTSTGETEWLEVNYTGPTPLNLTGWQLIDSSGTTRTLTNLFTTTGLNLISWSGSLLNNSGDSFQLLDPDGQLFLDGEFSGCSSGTSLIWDGSDWLSTTSITKLEPNPTTSSSPTPSSPPSTKSPTSTPTSPISSIADTTATPELPSTPHLVTTLPPLHLSISPHHPYASPSATVRLHDLPQPSISSLVRAILSCLLLTSVSGYLAYDRLEQHHQEMAHRLWTSLGLG